MSSEARPTIQLAIPIIIGELAQMSLHIIDTAMIGALGYKHLAAASLVVSAMNIPFVLGIGMTISVSQMVSMAHGKQDRGAVSHYLYNGFILCALTAVIISLIVVEGRHLLIYLGQDPEVVSLAKPFMTMIGLSIIPMLLFMTLKQFTDGLEFTKTAMVLSLFAVPVNAFLNWVLIYGNLGFPRLGLVGSGWATLVTRSLLFILLTIIITNHKLFKGYVSARTTQWYIRKKTIRELLHIGVPSALQVGIEVSAFAVSAIIIGTISAVALAAHQIALSCASFTFMISMGLSQAGSIRVSNAFGRKNWIKIGAIGVSTLKTALVYGSFCAVCFFVFRDNLPLLFNKNAEVIKLASLLVLFAAIFQISDSTQAVGAGLLRGIKDVRTPTVLIAIAYWAVALPVGLVLAFYFKLGAVGMWTGLILGLTFASGFLARRFLKMVKMKRMDTIVAVQ
ncbi:MAG: MATE family efflux transporter [Candidatus Dadabacteria bacterium]